jgi:hypothetical protein
MMSIRLINPTCVVCIKVLLHPSPIGVSLLISAHGRIHAHIIQCCTKQYVLIYGVVPGSPLWGFNETLIIPLQVQNHNLLGHILAKVSL